MPRGRREQLLLLICLAAMITFTGYSVARTHWQERDGRWELELTQLEDEGAQAFDDEDSEPEPLIYVHVAGQVHTPGVYLLPARARVVHAVEAAGGFASAAAPDAVNLAMVLSDGQRIYIPGHDELDAVQTAAAGLVSINRGDRSALESLPGIGPALAAEIISYRTRHGPFATVEALIKVSGIGEKTVDRLRQLVVVD